MASLLCQDRLVRRIKPPVRTTKIEEHRLKGKRKGAVLKEQFRFEDGRVLGYDNGHDYHHRHFMGTVEPIAFTTYADLADKFIAEVHELWRIEDEEE